MHIVEQGRLKYLDHIMTIPVTYRLLLLFLQRKVDKRRKLGRRAISWRTKFRKWSGVTDIERLRAVDLIFLIIKAEVLKINLHL